MPKTPEEIEIRKLIKRARAKSIEADEAMNKAMNALLSLIPDAAGIESDAENASNLDEAVLCYIGYGEFGLDNIMREIHALIEGDPNAD